MSFLLNRASVIGMSLLLAASASFLYVRTGGVKNIPAGNVGFVDRIDGSYSQIILQPGVRLVTPVWERINVIEVKQTTTTGILKGKTLEGLPVSVVLQITFERESNADLFAGTYDNGSDSFASELNKAIACAFESYAGKTTSLSFVPIESVEQNTDIALLSYFNSDAQLQKLGAKVIQVQVKRKWLTPELQVPIETIQQLDQIVKDVGSAAHQQACLNNPNCNSD